jgi:hypothetical protein
MEQQLNEEWRTVPGDHLYQVSNLGRVRRYFEYDGKWVVKKLSSSKGYLTTSMLVKSCKKSFKVHKLVMEAFTPKATWKSQVNHKDGNKQNNRIDNLEWSTAKENITHAIETGLRNHRLGNHFKAKAVIDTKTGKEYSCAKLASIETGVNYSTLRDYLNNRKPNKTTLKYAS